MLKVAIIDSGIDWDILKNNEVIDSKSFLYKNKKIEINDNVILRTETGINPFFMGGDEPLNINARNLCRPESWVLNPSGFNTADYSYSMNFIVQLNIEGTLSLDENDIVGAYVDGKLRGIAKIQYQPSLNKHLAFLTVYSNVNTGEEIKFQIWDASDCKLYAYAVENFTFLARFRPREPSPVFCIRRPLSFNSHSLSTSCVVGVGHNPDSFPAVRCTHVACSYILPFRIIPDFRKGPEDLAKSPVNKHPDIFHDRESWS